MRCLESKQIFLRLIRLSTFTFWSLLAFSCSLSLSWEMILKTISAAHVRCCSMCSFLVHVQWSQCRERKREVAAVQSDVWQRLLPAMASLRRTIASCLCGRRDASADAAPFELAVCEETVRRHKHREPWAEVTTTLSNLMAPRSKARIVRFLHVYYELQDSASHTVRWTVVVVVTTCTVLFESDIRGSIQLQLWDEPTSALRLVGPRSFGRHAGFVVMPVFGRCLCFTSSWTKSNINWCQIKLLTALKK